MNFSRWVVFTFVIQILVIVVDKGAGLVLLWLADGDAALVGAANTLSVLPFVLMAIANLGLATSLVYHIRRHEREVQAVAETTSTVALVWGGLVGIGSYLVIQYLVRELKPEWELNEWLVLPICLSVPFLLLSSYFNSIQLATERIKAFNMLHLLGSLSFLPFFLFFYWIFGESVTKGMAFSRLATALLLSIVVVITLRGLVRFRMRMHWDLLREGVAFGWKANITSTLTYLNLRLNILLIPLFFIAPGTPANQRDMTLAEVAFYGWALTFAELVWHFPEATRDLFFSKIAGSTDAHARKLTPILCRLCLLVSVLGGLAIYPMVDPVMGLFTDKWDSIWRDPVLTNLMILLPGTVAFTLAKVLQNDLAARGNLNQCIVACCLVFVVMVGLDIWLIPEMGSLGASIACTSAYAVSSLYTLWAYHRSTGVAYSHCVIAHGSDWQYVREIIAAVVEKLRGRRR